MKTGGANKILVSQSSNGGASFTNTLANSQDVVPQSPNQVHADQWFQWAAFSNAGKLAVSYYDRGYGSDITTGARTSPCLSRRRRARR